MVSKAHILTKEFLKKELNENKKELYTKEVGGCNQVRKCLTPLYVAKPKFYFQRKYKKFTEC